MKKYILAIVLGCFLGIAFAVAEGYIQAINSEVSNIF